MAVPAHRLFWERDEGDEEEAPDGVGGLVLVLREAEFISLFPLGAPVWWLPRPAVKLSDKYITSFICYRQLQQNKVTRTAAGHRLFSCRC